MSDSNPTNKDPITGEPGAHPLGTGLGAGGGALSGAAVGSVVAGPLGTVAGAILGAIVGGLTGKELSEGVNPTEGEIPEEHRLYAVSCGTQQSHFLRACAGGRAEALQGPAAISAGLLPRAAPCTGVATCA